MDNEHTDLSPEEPGTKAQDRSAGSAARSSGKRGWLRRGVRILGGIVLVLLLVVCGAFASLRLEAVQDILVEKINSALEEPLAAQGLSGRLTGLRGGLPFEMQAGIELSDAGGVFFTADSIRFLLEGSLFSPEIRLTDCTITDAVVHHVPVLPETPPVPEAPGEPMTPARIEALLNEIAATLTDLPKQLPRVVIREAGIRNLTVGRDVMGVEMSVTALLNASFDATGELPKVTFGLQELKVSSEDLDCEGVVSYATGPTKETFLDGALTTTFSASADPLHLLERLNAHAERNSGQAGSQNTPGDTRKDAGQGSSVATVSTESAVSSGSAGSVGNTVSAVPGSQSGAPESRAATSEASPDMKRPSKEGPGVSDASGKPCAESGVSQNDAPAGTGKNVRHEAGKQEQPQTASSGTDAGKSVPEGERPSAAQNLASGKSVTVRGRPVQYKLSIDGPLFTPKLSSTLHVDALAMEGQTIEDTTLSILSEPLDLKALLLPLRTGSPSGTPSGNPAELGARISLTGKINHEPVSLSLPLFARRTTDTFTAFVAGMRGFVCRAMGLDAGATLAAEIGTGPDPVLTGDLKAKIQDWHVVSVFVPGKRLNGVVDASVSLSAKDSVQNARVRLDVPGFSMDEGSSPLVHVEGLHVDTTVSDLFHVEKMTLASIIQGRQVVAGPLRLGIAAKASGSVQGRLEASLETHGTLETKLAAAYEKNTVSLSTLSLLAERSLLQGGAPARPSSAASSVQASGVSGKSSGKSSGKASRRSSGKSSGKSGKGGQPQKAVHTVAAPSHVGIRLVRPVTVRLEDQGFATTPLALEMVPTGRLSLDGGLSSRKVQLGLALQQFDLERWKWLVPELPKGRVECTAALQGSPQNPTGSLKVGLAGIAMDGLPLDPVDLALEGHLANRVLAAHLDVSEKTKKTLGLDQLGLQTRVPLVFAENGVPGLSPSSPLDAVVDLKGKLGPLWRLAALADSRLTGNLSAHVQAHGLLSALALKGDVVVDKGRFEDPIYGLLLKDLGCNVNLSGRTDSSGMHGDMRVRAGFTDGMGGSFSLEGTTPLDASVLNFTAKLDHLRPLRRQDVRISLSGNATVTGSATDPKIRGGIVVDNGALQLENIETGPAGVTTLPITDRKAAAQRKASAGASGKHSGKTQAVSAKTDTRKKNTPKKDTEGVGSIHLTVKSPGRFLVDGYGLSSAWNTDLLIQGPLTEPVISGEISCEKGSLDFLNKLFTMEKGIITLAGGNVANPLLDMLLTNTTNDFTSHIRITGTVQKLKLTLSSEPEMPQDDVMAQILFGKNANELGRYEALQLAAAMARMASGLGSGLNSPRKALGLDVMRLKSGESGSSGKDDSAMGGMAVETGKYLTDSIYVGVEQGAQQGSTAGTIQFEITPRLRLELRSQQNNTSGSLNWKYKY